MNIAIHMACGDTVVGCLEGYGNIISAHLLSHIDLETGVDRSQCGVRWIERVDEEARQ